MFAARHRPRIAGRWAVSRVALQMLLEDDLNGLRLYLAGDRRSLAVTSYFTRLGVPIPRQGNGIRKALSEPTSVSLRESA